MFSQGVREPLKATKLTAITFIALTIVSILIGAIGGAILLNRVRQSYHDLEIETNQRQGDRVAMLFEYLANDGMGEKEILSLFQKTIASTSGTMNRFICIISDEGEVLCHPSDAALGNSAKNMVLNPLGTKKRTDYSSWVRSEYDEAYLLSADGKPYDLIHRVPVQNFSWQILVHTRLNAIEGQVHQIQRTIIMGLVPMLAAFVLVGTFVARIIGRRYEAAIEESNRELEAHVTDRTRELSRTVEELQQTRSALVLNEKMALLGQLVAGIAHEINNPLGAISIHAQTLEEDLKDEEDQAAVRTINQSAQRCSHLVTNLLAFARNSPPRREGHTTNEIINTALAFCAADLRQHSISLRKNLTDSNPVLEVDRIQIEQVILNLVTNAAQALSARDGERVVSVSSETDESHVVVTVEDNGPGLSQDIEESIFEPFHTTKEEGSGTGLGLSLCRRFIEHHGGSISYEASDLGGAKFQFNLPKENANGGNGHADALFGEERIEKG